MHKQHKLIINEIQKHAKKPATTGYFNIDVYLGNSDYKYAISTPVFTKLAKDWIKTNRNISLTEFTETLNSLYNGKSFDEKVFGSVILKHFPSMRAQLDPNLVYDWLTNLVGWCEIDMLCQMNFGADEILSKWSIWKKLLIKLSKDKNISRRRASLVLLTKPLRQSGDQKFYELAIKTVETLKSEKDILITKAVSWALRAASIHHKVETKSYITNNLTTLPRIAIREALKKIETGRKS